MTTPFTKDQRDGFIASGPDPLKVARWGFDLIFGGYKQSTGVLERLNRSPQGETSGFCCVGVLCKTQLPGKAREIEHGEVYYNVVNSFGRIERDNAWIDPSDIIGGDPYEEGGDYPDFAPANDDRGATFREIGLWLLSTVPALIVRKFQRG